MSYFRGTYVSLYTQHEIIANQDFPLLTILGRFQDCNFQKLCRLHQCALGCNVVQTICLEYYSILHYYLDSTSISLKRPISMHRNFFKTQDLHEPHSCKTKDYIIIKSRKENNENGTRIHERKHKLKNQPKIRKRIFLTSETGIQF